VPNPIGCPPVSLAITVIDRWHVITRPAVDEDSDLKRKSKKIYKYENFYNIK
jgi:hypothetical protein